MTSILWSWAISALLLVVLAVVVGRLVKPPVGLLGILIDGRGRFSLTHLQIALWTLVVLSLISGVFWGRLIDGVNDPLGFSIPDEVLGLMGIAVGSTLATTAIKSTKDTTSGERIAASGTPVAAVVDPPRFGQIFLQEEGTFADRVVDIAKFQNFVITIVLVVAYIALSIDAIDAAKTAAGLKALPTFSGTFLTLLGISHGGYVIGKIPPRPGEPLGLTVENRKGFASGALPAASFEARNA
jgi:hypothetical protein